MGNYISCTFVPPLTKNAKVTRVISPSGELKQFREVVNAAELMLDHPNYFLVNSRSLHIGRRFSAIGADEDLEFGNLYIFFPMRRVNSVVTAADMAVLFLAANSAAKRISGSGGKARVQPDKQEEDNHHESQVPRLNLEGVLDSSSSSGFESYRLSYSRSRKPVLATINEEPIKGKKLYAGVV